MIREALDFIQKAINDYLTAIHATTLEDSPEELVLGNVAFAHDNSAESDFMNKKLVLSLVNVEEDRLAKHPLPYKKKGAEISLQNPAIHLNLYLLFTANYDSYDSAMGALSTLIGFFQRQNYFTRDNYPGLDEGIEKLIFELYSMNLEQVYHLWGMLGGKYIPSVLYKMNMLTIQQSDTYPASLVKSIKTVENML